MPGDNRFAVLIDADNISAKYIKIILDELAKDGISTYRRIYGDWTSPSLGSWKNTLLNYSVQPVQQYSYTTGKNSTDSAMIIDAMDILYSGKVDGFCLVSSDSDFTRLAARLRESGMIVIGMGESKTPNSFIAACNKFKYLDILASAEEEEGEEAAASRQAAAVIERKEPAKEKEEQCPEALKTNRRTICKALRTIAKENSDEDNWVNVSKVGNLLGKRYPDFDVRNFGYSKLTTFLESLEIFEVKRERKDADSPPLAYVRLK